MWTLEFVIPVLIRLLVNDSYVGVHVCAVTAFQSPAETSTSLAFLNVAVTTAVNTQRQYCTVL